MVGQFGQGLGLGYTDADRNTGTSQYLAADLPAKYIQVINACQVCEGFVDVKERLWAMDIATGQSWSVFAINPRCPYFNSIFPRKNESVSIRHCMDPTVYLLHSAKTPELNACQ